MDTEVMFSKKSDQWSTPQDFYEELDREFHFTLDAAADERNHKCTSWYGPGGIAPNALAVAWSRHRVVWLNPPYSRCADFIDKAQRESAVHNCTVVCLVPARTDTRWWHSFVWDSNRPHKGVEVRFIKGRLKFGDSENSAPFPSVIVVFKPCR